MMWKGEIGGSGHTCTPVKSLSALSHPLRHSTIHLAAQSRITFGIRAEKDLRDYFIFIQTSCLVDETSQ